MTSEHPPGAKPRATTFTTTAEEQRYRRALDVVPTGHNVVVDGATIHYLRWPGPPAAPGLLFVHGHAAHAHWWDWVAPHYAGRFNVAAIDLSGCGDSDHRPVYTSAGYKDEMLAVARDAGLGKPILVGHSFGGTLARIAAHLAPDAFAGLLLVDSALSSSPSGRSPPKLPVTKTRCYTTEEEAARRFRLRPPQPVRHLLLARHIARHSVKATPQGYCFKLDPALFAKMTAEPDYPDAHTMMKSLTVDTALIYGTESRFFPPEVVEKMPSLFAPDRIESIAGAHHHVFLDDPTAFLHALDRLLIHTDKVLRKPI